MNGQVPWFSSAQNIRGHDLLADFLRKLDVPTQSRKLKSQKFAPRLRARTIWKSKSLKHQGLGPLFEVQSAFRVAGAGVSIRFKMRGRRTSSWGLQKRWQGWWIWRGSEMMRFAWQGQGFRALRCRWLRPSTQNPWKGCKFHDMPRLNFFVAGAVLLKHPLENR